MPEITVPENIIQKDSAREGSFLNKAVSFEPQNIEVKDGGSVWLRYKSLPERRSRCMNRKIVFTVLFLLIGAVIGCSTASPTEDSISMEMNSDEESIWSASLRNSISQEGKQYDNDIVIP